MLTLESNSASPRYEQIKDGLRREVALGKIKAGSLIPSEEELAEQLNVSRMTVRRALVELTREGLLHRVIGKGTFVRDNFAPQKKRSKNVISVLFPDNAAPGAQLDFFYYRILHGVFAGANDSDLMITYSKVSGSPEDFVLNLRRDKALRGLIVLGVSDQRVLQALTKVTVPIVLLDSVQPESGSIFDEVNHSGEPGVFAAVSYLIRLGYRSIALMPTDNPNALNIERRQGYERALAAHGIALRNELIHPVPIYPEAAYAAMRGILNSADVPTAVVCTSDQLAVGAMAAVNDHGWRVPKDISIVGYGDEGYFTSPRLSTVHVPLEQMGIKAAELIGQRLKDATMPVKRIQLPTEWTLRGTCECPPVRR
jgi:LacI family transcriptional regulator